MSTGGQYRLSKFAPRRICTSGRSVDRIMRNVVYALLPVCFYSVWLFGISAAALIATTTGACVLIEHLSCRMTARETTIGDFSVAITGLLLGLTLPPGFPLWMAVVGAFIAVAPGKMIFGGLGFNVFNPALVGRAFLQAAFPSAITSYTPALAVAPVRGIYSDVARGAVPEGRAA